MTVLRVYASPAHDWRHPEGYADGFTAGLQAAAEHAAREANCSRLSFLTDLDDVAKNPDMPFYAEWARHSARDLEQAQRRSAEMSREARRHYAFHHAETVA